MGNRVVIDNPLPGPDMPSDIGIGEQPFPPRRASAHTDPHQQRDKEEIGKRRNRESRPPVEEQMIDPDAFFVRKRRSSGNTLGRSHVPSYSPDGGWYFSAKQTNKRFTH